MTTTSSIPADYHSPAMMFVAADGTVLGPSVPMKSPAKAQWVERTPDGWKVLPRSRWPRRDYRTWRIFDRSSKWDHDR